MQLLDVIMGAVGYKNRGYLEKEKGEAKKEIVRYIEKNSPKTSLYRPLLMNLNLIFLSGNHKGLKNKGIQKV